MSRTVLVTGASGFVGVHLLRLLEADPDLEIHAWTRDVVPEGTRARWVVLEVADRQAVSDAIAETRPGLVYHLAGAAHVGQSFGSVTETLATNVMGTAHLLDALRDQRVAARTLVIGSSTVYRPSEEALTEDSPIGPTSPYGLSKLAQERLAIRASREDDLDVLVVRSFNHFGPGQAPSFFAPAFARQIAEIEAGLRAPALRVGNLDARRDLTDVRDTVRAYRLLMAHGARGQVYNMCSGRAYRVGDVLHALIRRSRAEVDVQVDPGLLRPSDNPVVRGSYVRLEAATGWTPAIPLERTIDDLLDDWRERVGRSRTS
jgi:GDP-4-dehydro-6-deoxy-D-mannose reductase